VVAGAGVSELAAAVGAAIAADAFDDGDAVDAVDAAGVAWDAFVPDVVIGSSGTISKATMLMILINGLTAGPAVSL